jgi:hypothetical protein
MKLVYRCPECRGKFPPVTGEPEPTRCYAPQKSGTLGCGYSYPEVDDNVIYMPALLSDKTKSIDGTARAIQDGGDQRAQLAAELTGASVADMSALKIPDPSQPPSVNPNSEVKQSMNMAPQMTGFNPAAGAQFAAGTRVGPHANAGAHFAGKIQSTHKALERSLSVSGKRS